MNIGGAFVTCNSKSQRGSTATATATAKATAKAKAKATGLQPSADVRHRIQGDKMQVSSRLDSSQAGCGCGKRDQNT